jgi:hypothetical protein
MSLKIEKNKSLSPINNQTGFQKKKIQSKKGDENKKHHITRSTKLRKYASVYKAYQKQIKQAEQSERKKKSPRPSRSSKPPKPNLIQNNQTSTLIYTHEPRNKSILKSPTIKKETRSVTLQRSVSEGNEVVFDTRVSAGLRPNEVSEGGNEVSKGKETRSVSEGKETRSVSEGKEKKKKKILTSYQKFVQTESQKDKYKLIPGKNRLKAIAVEWKKINKSKNVG